MCIVNGGKNQVIGFVNKYNGKQCRSLEFKLNWFFIAAKINEPNDRYFWYFTQYMIFTKIVPLEHQNIFLCNLFVLSSRSFSFSLSVSMHNTNFPHKTIIEQGHIVQRERNHLIPENKCKNSLNLKFYELAFSEKFSFSFTYIHT